MTPSQMERLLDIRWRGKTGKLLSEEEQAFAILMHAEWPAQYRDVEAELMRRIKSAAWHELL